VPIQIPPPPPQASSGCTGPGGKPRESTPMIHGPSSIGFRHQESSQGGWGSGEESPPPTQDYPTDGGQHHHSATSTIRRKSKRDRNKTTCVVTSERTGNCVSASYSHHTLPAHGGSGGKTGNNIACNKTNNKGRSKSRSPGRRGGGMDRAIVIVHHTTCAHHSRSREPSPDNLSESSLSYTQDNELMSGESGEGSDMVIPPMPPVRTSSVDHLMHADTTAPPAAWMDGPVGKKFFQSCNNMIVVFK
jgi:hypothetical protein